MKITDSAAQAVLEVMKKKKLDPNHVFLEIGIFEGNLGMAFTREKLGRSYNFGELTVVIRHDVDAAGVLVDFGEINGRKGLVFRAEAGGT